VKVSSDYGMFTIVPIDKSSEKIKLSFSPDGMKTGILVSLLGIACLILVMFMEQKTGVLNNDYKWLTSLYYFGFIVIMVLMYTVPYVFRFVSLIL